MLTVTIGRIDNTFTIFDGENTDTYQGDEMGDFWSTYFLNDARKNSAIFWHFNLSYYAEDILMILHKMGYTDVTRYDPTISEMKSRDYKYLISDEGVTYRIIVKVGHKTTYIYNSDNLLSNISDEEIINDFNDDMDSEPGVRLAKGIYKAVFLLNGFRIKKTPFTISMYAQADWKQREGLYLCDNLIDANKYMVGDNSLSDYIRKSYHGGWNYRNENTQVHDKAREEGGLVYDVNSLYPFIMKNKPMPWGTPELIKGKPDDKILSDKYRYYFIHVICKFELKEGHFPFIQKKDSMYYWGRDYLETSDIIRGDGTRVKSVIGTDGKRKEVKCELILSKTDWEMMQRHYDVFDIEYIDCVVFHTCRHVFDTFVDYHYKQKIKADKSGERGIRRIEKIIMNSVSGGLAKRKQRTNIIIDYDENDVTDYDIKKTELQNPSYIYLASAILSYAREYTYETAYEYRDRFLYSDTDSLHLAGKEIPEDLIIDQQELGAWKLEKEFEDAIYYKKKLYTLKTKDGFKCTLAGVDKISKKVIQDYMMQAYYESDFLKVFDAKYKSALTEKDLLAFDNNPGKVGLRNLKETLTRRLEFESDVDPMYNMMYAEYPTIIQWGENFNIYTDVKWCKINL